MKTATFGFSIVFLFSLPLPVSAGENGPFEVAPPAWGQTMPLEKAAGASEAVAWRFQRFSQAAEFLQLDRSQTLGICHRPGFYEMNPVLGKRPSDSKINAYFLAINALIFWGAVALPEPWASSLADSVRFTERLVTDQNARLFATGKTERGLPIGVINTTRF